MKRSVVIALLVLDLVCLLGGTAWVTATFMFRRTYARVLDVNLIGQAQYDMATSALDRLATDMLIPCMIIAGLNLLCVLALCVLLMDRRSTSDA
ncbi:MAG: hypothetical protein KDA29_10430 [Phycisphaerales bacterium]|nr:hypothetical protein [Phycisphaerales bacterium]